MKLLVISPTPGPERAERMIATAKRVGVAPVLYGAHCRDVHGGDYQGTEIIKILQERTDAEYVMGVDAFDVAFVSGEDEILDKLLAFPHRLVLSTELEGFTGNNKTKEELQRQCTRAGGYHAQLNIGGWIGERGYALHVFKEAERLWRHRPEDPSYSYDVLAQWLMMLKAWGSGGMGDAPEFSMDIHCEIFQSMNYTEFEWIEEEKRIVNKATGTKPCVLHYNGDKSLKSYGEMVAKILT